MWSFKREKDKEILYTCQQSCHVTYCPACGVAFLPRFGWYYIGIDGSHVKTYSPISLDSKYYRTEDATYCSRCVPEFKNKADTLKWASENLDLVGKCKEAYENGGKEL